MLYVILVFYDQTSDVLLWQVNCISLDALLSAPYSHFACLRWNLPYVL